jgi:hypothetical protein
VACLPLLLEHLVFYEAMIGTMTHTSALTKQVAIASLPPSLPVVVKKKGGSGTSEGGGGGDKKLDLLGKLELARLDSNLQKGAKWREKEYGGMPFPVLPRRLRTDRADGKGFFAQHPQFANHWYEVDETDHVFGYTEVEQVKEGEEFILQDKSTPRRADVFVRIVVGVKAEQGASKAGPWSKWLDLRACDAADGCVYIPAYDKAGRKVFKFKGGCLEEIADGQVWAESNVDTGPALFWFGMLHENARRIVAWDGSRDIWVMVKPPPPAVGKPKMSARELSTATILLAIGGSQQQIGKDRWAPWMMLGQPCDPDSTCLAARKRSDAKLKAEKAGPPLHMVFNVDSNPKYQWLVQFFSFWWQQSQDKSKGSTFTRLLTADKPDSLMDKIPTFMCKPPHDLLAKDSYVPYNKITSVMQWIQAKHAELPADQIVVIMDVDVVLLEDISYFAINVKKGQPLGTKGFMSFTGEDTPMDRMVQRYCKGCDGADPLAVPYFIHKDDLLKLAPRWLEKAKVKNVGQISRVFNFNFFLGDSARHDALAQGARLASRQAGAAELDGRAVGVSARSIRAGLAARSARRHLCIHGLWSAAIAGADDSLLRLDQRPGQVWHGRKMEQGPSGRSVGNSQCRSQEQVRNRPRDDSEAAGGAQGRLPRAQTLVGRTLTETEKRRWLRFSTCRRTSCATGCWRRR